MKQLATIWKKLKYGSVLILLLSLAGCFGDSDEKGGDGTGIQGYQFYAGQFDPKVSGGLRAAIYRRAANSVHGISDPGASFYIVDLVNAPDLQVPFTDAQMQEFTVNSTGVAGVDGYSGVFAKAATADPTSTFLVEGCFNQATSGTRIYGFVRQVAVGSFKLNITVIFSDGSVLEIPERQAVVSVDVTFTNFTYTTTFPGASAPFQLFASGSTCTFSGEVPSPAGGFENVSATSARKYTPPTF